MCSGCRMPFLTSVRHPVEQRRGCMVLNPLFELFRGACCSGNMRRVFSEKKRIRALYANETNYVHVAPVHVEGNPGQNGRP